MMKRLAADAVVLVLAALGMAGCERQDPLPGPSGEAALAVTAVDPPRGVIGSAVRISGAGFSSGATVTIGGMATNARFSSSTLITATAPVDTTDGVNADRPFTPEERAPLLAYLRKL